MLLFTNFKTLKAMTKLTFTLLLGWLLLLSSNLNAQNREGLFNLKEGDWFEMQVTSGNWPYLLRYQLIKQLQNKNQQYLLSIENTKVMSTRAISTTNDGSNFGYDSYYPAYEENKTEPDKNNQYNIEVTSEGKIVKFKSFPTNKENVYKLQRINSAYYNFNDNRSLTIASNDSSLIKDFSAKIMSLSLIHI